MDWSLPGSSVHRIFQARVLEWDAITFSAILLGIYNDLTVVLGFPGSSAGQESACNTGDSCSISGSERSTGEGIGYPLQYSGLENSLDSIVHGVAKGQTQLSDFHFHFHILYH